MAPSTALHQRLLQDIREIQSNPYPGIYLHVEDNLNQACLVLSPEGEPPLHLTIDFTDYPLNPPHVTIQSQVSHPNVFGQRICISLLECEEGYTPAYTIKGICIQLLSFFSSDQVQQMWGENGGLVDRKKWQSVGTDGSGVAVSKDTHCCSKCGFGDEEHVRTMLAVSRGEAFPSTTANETLASDHRAVSDSTDHAHPLEAQLTNLPNDVLLILCDHLDNETLLRAAGAWFKIGELINKHNIIRTRELQCFTLKKGFRDAELGVGVHIQNRIIESEFDLISREAYHVCGVRRSIQGLPFELWLPLPLAERHWERVKLEADIALKSIARSAGISASPETVLYSMMNGIVVRLSAASEQIESRVDRAGRVRGQDGELIKSSLTHASEKAVESYFHLFHLLICYAVELPAIANAANKLIEDFVCGSRDKQSCPNIGYLLIAILISDVEVTEDLTKSVIKESVTRNVVWMLEAPPTGKGYAELSYLEPSAISMYRLQKTFDAGRTSYRLLMFLNLMRKVVRAARNTEHGEKMTLQQLRDDLFRRYGAPPPGAAAKIAQSIRDIQKVNSFPEFLKNMGIQQSPTPKSFTTFLKGTVSDSMRRGYSQWALTQEQALHRRLRKEGPHVAWAEGVQPQPQPGGLISFFPKQGGPGGRGGRGGRVSNGERGRGRGRGGHGQHGW